MERQKVFFVLLLRARPPLQIKVRIRGHFTHPKLEMLERSERKAPDPAGNLFPTETTNTAIGMLIRINPKSNKVRKNQSKGAETKLRSESYLWTRPGRPKGADCSIYRMRHFAGLLEV